MRSIVSGWSGQVQLSLRARLRIALTMALLAATIPAFMVLKSQYAVIQSSRNELAGIDPALAASKLVLDLQGYRRASIAAMTQRPQDPGDDLGAIAQQIDRQIAAVEAAFSDSRLELASNDDWKALKTDWPRVRTRSTARDAKALEIIAAESALVMSALAVVEHAGASSTLLLDPSDAAYYLVVNALIEGQQLKEYVGRARAHGRLLWAGEPGQQLRDAVLADLGQISDTRRAYRRNLERALAANPDAARPLVDKFAEAERAMDRIAAQIANDSAGGEPGSAGAKDYAAMTRIAIDAMAELNGNTLRNLRSVLDARIAGQTSDAAILAGVLLALTLGMALTVRGVNRSIHGGIERACKFANAVARQDLSQRLQTRRTDEMGELMRALDEMGSALAGIVESVRSGSDSFATTSQQISTATADLSGRTEQTASNLQQTAASMSHLTDSVRENADAALRANELAGSAGAAASRGGSVVARVVDTMDAINGSSKRIAEIIGVIDAIAFQTNILALNAAVEAARAGEQGRGFAVVASEVRSLATRSADAAKEIKELIMASVQSVDSGAAQVREAGTAMNEILGAIDKVTQMVESISAATQRESTSIDEINQAVGQLDQMTQQNAAMVEQSAAACESLQAQARGMSERVAGFKLLEAAA